MIKPWKGLKEVLQKKKGLEDNSIDSVDSEFKNKQLKALENRIKSDYDNKLNLIYQEVQK